jgi:hypothetical protein
MSHARDGLLVTLVTAALTAGCSNDLPAASHLERTRALGARVQVADAATNPADSRRASVAPGEAASVEWLVASPTGDPGPFAWTFATCVAVDGACVEASSANGAGTGLPVLVPFTTPDASQLTAPRVALMTGTLEGIDDVRFAIPVEPPGDAPNHHPNLANDTVLLNGAAWDATDAAPPPGASCDAGSGLITIAPRASTGQDATDAEKLLVRLITDADDRETYVPEGATTPTLEDLQISNFATAGAFDGSYAEIPPADTRPDADAVMKWGPPSFTAVPPVGLVVQLHLVMRDGRGGLDWLHRSLCVLAP